MAMIADDARSYFKCKPYDHQVEAHKLARDRDAFAFLMEMGTGKSPCLTSVMAYQHARGKINAALILAPKSVCRTWVDEQLPKHYPDHGFQPLVKLWTNSTTKRDLDSLNEMFRPCQSLKVLVMNIEALSTPKGFKYAERYVRAHHALVAVDESTRIKSNTAARTKNAIKLSRLAKSRFILTGMPITQSPLDIFSQYDFLDHSFLGYSNFFSFKARYAELRRRVINGKSFDEIVGYQRLDELQELVLRNGYRKLKSECLDLPEKIYAPDRSVQLGDLQRKYYEQMRDDAIIQLEGQAVTAPLVMTQLLRLRQVLCGVVPALLDDHKSILLAENPRMTELENVVEEVEGKVLIWCSFVPIIREICKQLGDSAVAFYGDVSQEARQYAINEFQDPNSHTRFFVGQVHTGGIGLNLTAARTVIYYDNDWSLEARAQSEDRAHRIGQEGHVTYINLVAPGTVDEMILKALKGKKSLADQVTGDGWRSVFK